MANGNWYQYQLKVDGQQRIVSYTIARKSTGSIVASGTYALPEGTTSTRLQGFYYLAGRYYGSMKIDNIKVIVPKGDVNGDGKVTIADAVAIVNHILGQTPSAFNMLAADVDNDSEVSIADAIAVVNIILSNSAGL